MCYHIYTQFIRRKYYSLAAALLQPELSLLKILPVEFDRDAVIVSPEQDTHLSRKAPEP